MNSVDLAELQFAVELVSDGVADSEAYVCRRTGRVFLNSEDGDLEQESYPDNVDDPDKYAPVPSKYDLDIGVRLPYDFTKRHAPDQHDEVRSIFRRKGAYGRFKALLANRDLLEKWFAFSEEQTMEALADWCATEGFSTK